MTWTYRAFSILVALGRFFGFAPGDHAPSGHWIDINLSNQTATAYDGDSAVKTVGVTPRRPGFATPTGTFYVQSRVANETMDSRTIGIPLDSPIGYFLPNAYCTQHFSSFVDGIDAKWWSPPSVFGSYPTSHSCVGMMSSDAAWFWDFATFGTPVVIHY